MGGGSTGGGAGSTGGGSSPPPAACTGWNVSGSWSWVTNGSGSGPNNGSASLSQSGNSITGTVTDSSGTWNVSGSISGSTVNLNFTAPPGLAGASGYQGTVDSTGNQIVGSNYGSFTNRHAACTG